MTRDDAMTSDFGAAPMGRSLSGLFFFHMAALDVAKGGEGVTTDPVILGEDIKVMLFNS